MELTMTELLQIAEICDGWPKHRAFDVWDRHGNVGSWEECTNLDQSTWSDLEPIAQIALNRGYKDHRDVNKLFENLREVLGLEFLEEYLTMLSESPTEISERIRKNAKNS